MNAQCPFPFQPFSDRPQAQRKDVLAVAGEPLTKPFSPGEALRKLENLGFGIEQPGTGRWVLSKAGMPLRIYLYGSAELAAFANDRALAYACGFNHPETNQHTLELVYDTPCSLPG